MSYQQPWRAQTHTFPVAFLPAFVGGLFDMQMVAKADQVIDQRAMQGLTLCRQPPGLIGQSAAGFAVPLAVVPAQPLRALALDPSPGIIVGGIICAALPIQAALQ